MSTAPTTPERKVERPTAAQLSRAREVIAEVLAPTPLIDSLGLGAGALLKLDSFQPTGSFKVRGALTALSELPAGQETVTASSGNHALAVTWAARRLGRTATVVVPRTTSPAKLSALQEADARLVIEGETFIEAETHAIGLARDGVHFLSAYNDPLVIAGQATIAAELEQLEGPLTIVVPVGGGGLLAGVGLWAQAHGDVRVVAVEAEASQAMRAAMQARRIVRIEHGPSLADAIVGNIEPGAVTLPIVLETIDDLVTVGESEIAEAMRFLAREHGVVAEGAGAVAPAALLAGRVPLHGRPVALVTARNVALPLLADVLRGVAPA